MNKFSLTVQIQDTAGQWNDQMALEQFAMGTLAEYAIEIENGYRPMCIKADVRRIHNNNAMSNQDINAKSRLRGIVQIFA